MFSARHDWRDGCVAAGMRFADAVLLAIPLCAAFACSDAASSPPDGGSDAATDSSLDGAGADVTQPRESCPAYASVTYGGSCDVDPSLWCGASEFVADCDGGVLARGACKCVGGTWSVCSIDAGVPLCCPDAAVVTADAMCGDLGQRCSGQVTSCGDAADTFLCSGWGWVDITSCAADGGD